MYGVQVMVIDDGSHRCCWFLGLITWGSGKPYPSQPSLIGTVVFTYSACDQLMFTSLLDMTETASKRISPLDREDGGLDEDSRMILISIPLKSTLQLG